MLGGLIWAKSYTIPNLLRALAEFNPYPNDLLTLSFTISKLIVFVSFNLKLSSLFYSSPRT